MSFLNPINEPVLMYSSTDANAPQINYAARAKGDVKTVLKACLVTGYGTKQGAGWTIKNETSTAARFVSPSALLSDYQLCIDDNSTEISTFYYTYKVTRVNPNINTLSKLLNYVALDSPKNTWTLLVTKQGFLWIEKFAHSDEAIECCRILYLGRIKSALTKETTKNINFYNFGFNGGVIEPSQFFPNNYNHVVLDTYTLSKMTGANLDAMSSLQVRNLIAIEVTNSVFLSSDGVILGEMLPFLPTIKPRVENLFGLYQTTFNNRPALYICIGGTSSGQLYYLEQACQGCYVYLDSWGY